LTEQDFYLTIKAPSRAVYKEKGSKFLSFSYPVIDEKDVKQHLEKLRKEYFDASHHCYAYILGASSEKFRANDDGEPHHSAGDPILGQLRSRNLTNTLIIVVRYFGGTKLGVGGLITAYRAAAEAVLSNSDIVKEEITISMSIQFDYSATPEVMRLVKSFTIQIQEQQSAESNVLRCNIPLRNYQTVKERLEQLKAAGKMITWGLHEN
jgi:uncharacterized YigZ family protein